MLNKKMFMMAGMMMTVMMMGALVVGGGVFMQGKLSTKQMTNQAEKIIDFSIDKVTVSTSKKDEKSYYVTVFFNNANTNGPVNMDLDVYVDNKLFSSKEGGILKGNNGSYGFELPKYGQCDTTLNNCEIGFVLDPKKNIVELSEDNNTFGWTIAKNNPINGKKFNFIVPR